MVALLKVHVLPPHLGSQLSLTKREQEKTPVLEYALPLLPSKQESHSANEMNSLSSQRPRSSPRCWALPSSNDEQHRDEPARCGGGEEQRRILIPSERLGGHTISRRFRTWNSALREPPRFLRYNFWHFVTRLILITVLCLPSGKCTDEYDTDWPFLRIPQAPEGTERLPA